MKTLSKVVTLVLNQMKLQVPFIYLRFILVLDMAFKLY